MPDAHFQQPRLAKVYDALDPDRRDLDLYVALADELGARTVVDIGCGTGVLALRLAASGRTVTAVDPAAGSLDVARGKPGAATVTWVLGDATSLPALQADLATMTGNVAQAIVAPEDWAATLPGIHRALRPGGHLVVESRDPAARAWQRWTPEATRAEAWLPEHVVSSVEVTAVSGPLVTFRTTFEFSSDGATLTSDSTLRFRGRVEVERDLAAHGFTVEDVRDAPDRPGQELVFLARR